MTLCIQQSGGKAPSPTLSRKAGAGHTWMKAAISHLACRGHSVCLWGGGRGGNRGRRRRRKENGAMGFESVLESFTTLAGSKCNLMKRLCLFVFIFITRQRKIGAFITFRVFRNSNVVFCPFSVAQCSLRLTTLSPSPRKSHRLPS